MQSYQHNTQKGLVSIQYPDNLSLSTVVQSIVPAITNTVVGTIAQAVGQGVVAVVEVAAQSSAKISYYNQYGAYLRDEVIPVVAATNAWQDGRNAIDSGRFDSDIAAAAQKALNKRMGRHF